MAFIDWGDNYSVGIVEIDDQHKKLFSMINELHEAMKHGMGNSILEKLLSQLSEYAQSHFKTEEDYFDKFAYEKTAEHKAEHAKFVAEVLRNKADFESEKIGISIAVTDFLADWLKNHILVTDKAYSSFLVSKGIK